MIVGKATVLQKSRLPPFLRPARRRLGAEAPAAHLAGDLGPVAHAPQRRIDQHGRHTGLRKFAPDARRALAAPDVVLDEVAGIALIIQEMACAQLPDEGLDDWGGKATLDQLGGEFPARVVA